MASRTPVDANYGKVLDEKRKAILNHLVGVCEHPQNQFYKKCNHGPLRKERLDPGNLHSVSLNVKKTHAVSFSGFTFKLPS